ncbi:MAG: GntR family transcriptional regulator [Pseudomonadota bacterium]
MQATGSQTDKALYGLRTLIVEGRLKPGDRVFEQTVVDAIGVSRTPARAALQRVSEEGLIDALPSGGYIVASFTDDDVFDGIAIRGNLEGMAARLAAEKGLTSGYAQALGDCLAALDQLLLSDDLKVVQIDYIRLNDRFHQLVAEASRSAMMLRALERLVAIPFSVNNSFVDVPDELVPQVLAILRDAQVQHHSILEAISCGEGTRAQALMNEHSRCAWRYLKLMRSHQQAYPTRLLAVPF